MSAIGPGDWVECLNDGGMPHVVSVGSIYLVEWAGMGPLTGLPVLILAGIRHPDSDGPYCRYVRASYFRPIYRPKADLIEGLLKPVEAPADLEGVEA